METENLQIRYSDAELAEFKEIILSKIEKAQNDLDLIILDMLMILHLVVAIMFIKKKAILGKNFNVLSRRMDLSSTIRKLDCKKEVAGKKSQV